MVLGLTLGLLWMWLMAPRRPRWFPSLQVGEVVYRAPGPERHPTTATRGQA